MLCDIFGFEGFYKISKNGDVYSMERNGTVNSQRVLRPTVGTNGYLKVSLRCNGNRHTRNIHRLLAQTFIDNPKNLPCVNHIDGNKLNNSLSNLEWASYSRNIQHAYDTGLTKALRGEGRSMLKNEDVLNIVEMKSSGGTLRGIAKKFGISASSVSDIVLGRTWSHITGIKFNPNKFRGKKSPTGEKGVIPSHNGKFDVFVFMGGRNIYIIRIAVFNKAKEAKAKADQLLASGMNIKQVVAALRSIFNAN